MRLIKEFFLYCNALKFFLCPLAIPSDVGCWKWLRTWLSQIEILTPNNDLDLTFFTLYFCKYITLTKQKLERNRLQL